MSSKWCHDITTVTAMIQRHCCSGNEIFSSTASTQHLHKEKTRLTSFPGLNFELWTWTWEGGVWGRDHSATIYSIDYAATPLHVNTVRCGETLSSSEQPIRNCKFNHVWTGNNFSTTSSSVPSAKVFSQCASHSWENLLFSTLLPQQSYQQLGSLLRNHVGLRTTYNGEWQSYCSY